MHSLTFAGWTLIAGAVMLLPVAFLTEGGPPKVSPSELAGLTWVSLAGAAFAYAILLLGVQRLPVALTAPLPLINPLTAALLGWAVRHESLSFWQLVGGACVFVCVIVGTRQPKTINGSADIPGDQGARVPTVLRSTGTAVPDFPVASGGPVDRQVHGSVS